MNKPKIELQDYDLNDPGGNAYFLMGAWKQKAIEAGWSQNQNKDVLEKAMDSNYDNLLGVLRKNSEGFNL